MIGQLTREAVRQRAHFRCEYCHLAQVDSPLAKLQIEHIRPRKHGGSDALDNLALACIDCNLRKGVNLTGIDPQTMAITPLFDPRSQAWADHFEFRAHQIYGRTAIGRASIAVLDLNSADRIQTRLATSAV